MIFLLLAELLRIRLTYSLDFKPNSSILFMLIYGLTDRKLALEFIANFHLLWFWDYVRWAQANLVAHAQNINLFLRTSTFWATKKLSVNWLKYVNLMSSWSLDFGKISNFGQLTPKQPHLRLSLFVLLNETQFVHVDST
jgi:hypothetical protein